MALTETNHKNKLVQYSEEVTAELKSILKWWTEYAVDVKQGGFYGAVDNHNHPQPEASKGIVLNSRILWTFSAAFLQNPDPAYKEIATRAFEYILQYFRDEEYGGVFWSVNQFGEIHDAKKQVYGQAFCIYGMAAYYKMTLVEEALNFARELFESMEKFSFDTNAGGYIEAFTRDWKETGDLRLSEKDENEKKTMNTHLHIIEAYAMLYSVWPEEYIRKKIGSLLDCFDHYIINQENHHLHLFMDENWNVSSPLISFGHDIEAAWLLVECSEIYGDELYKNKFKKIAVELANAAREGLDQDGGLWYEYDPLSRHLVTEKHSWPQAEAMIGFFNAFQLTGEPDYLQRSLGSWRFIKEHIIDREKGEWFWGINSDGSLMDKEKAGFWKGPYHSARACMEISKRIKCLQ